MTPDELLNVPGERYRRALLQLSRVMVGMMYSEEQCRWAGERWEDGPLTADEYMDTLASCLASSALEWAQGQEQ